MSRSRKTFNNKKKNKTAFHGLTDYNYVFTCYCGYKCEATTKKLMILKRRLHRKYCVVKITNKVADAEKTLRVETQWENLAK